MDGKTPGRRGLLPLPRGGGVGWGEGESLPRQWVLTSPLTLTLSKQVLI